jgi:LAS superfamily LD-carboxypeptidase LdcB
MAQLANLTTTLALESASFVSGIDQSRGAIRNLIASLDPAAAAQVKFNKQMDLAQKGLESGQISADLYEKVVARLQARLDAATQSFATVTDGQNRMGASGMILEHVVRSASDSFAAGTPITQIFGLEIGRLGEAVALSGGSFGKFGDFLTGPWGLALTFAVTALSPFVAKLFEGGDALDKEMDKLKKDADETKIAAQAKEAFARTLDGVEDALRRNEKALDDQAEAYRSVAEKAELAAKANLNQLTTGLAANQAALAASQKQLAQDQAGAKAGTPDSNRAFRLANLPGQITALQAQIKRIQSDITTAQNEMNAAQLQQVADFSTKSPIDKINDEYKRAVDQATNLAVKNHSTTDELQKQLDILKQQYDARLKAEQDRESAAKKLSSANHQSGRTVSLSEAEQIVQNIGGVITSATRTFDQQSKLYQSYLNGTGSLAAKPGHSDHETGNALDIAKTPGMSLGKIREAFERRSTMRAFRSSNCSMKAITSTSHGRLVPMMLRRPRRS